MKKKKNSVDVEIFDVFCEKRDEDNNAELPFGTTSKSGKRRNKGRAYRRRMERQHIQKYRDRDKYSNSLGSAYLKEKTIGDEDNVVGFYIGYPKRSNAKTYFKRVSNKKVRRERSLPPKGNKYRRAFDYWHTLY